MTTENAIKLFNALQSDNFAFRQLSLRGLIYFRDRRWRPTPKGVALGLHEHVTLEPHG